MYMYNKMGCIVSTYSLHMQYSVLYLSLYLLYTVGVLQYILYNYNCCRAGKRVRMFELPFVCYIVNFSLRSFTAMPTLMFAHVHLCNLNMWSIMWACSSKVEAVLLAASVSIHSPAMLNPSRNRKKTSTRYKAIIQFWRHSIANQDTCTCVHVRATLT